MEQKPFHAVRGMYFIYKTLSCESRNGFHRTELFLQKDF